MRYSFEIPRYYVKLNLKITRKTTKKGTVVADGNEPELKSGTSRIQMQKVTQHVHAAEKLQRQCEVCYVKLHSVYGAVFN
jgi:hypothetical protein